MQCWGWAQASVHARQAFYPPSPVPNLPLDAEQFKCPLYWGANAKLEIRNHRQTSLSDLFSYTSHQDHGHLIYIDGGQASTDQQMQTVSFIYLYLCVCPYAYHVLWRINLQLILSELGGKFTKSHYRFFFFFKKVLIFWLAVGGTKVLCVCAQITCETTNVKHTEMPFPKAGGRFY